jgi:hypothetical protein
MPLSSVSHPQSTQLTPTWRETAMAAVQRGEEEQMNGLLVRVADVRICGTADGQQLSSGGAGLDGVYKALMNGVDEVAMKLKVRSSRYRSIFKSSSKGQTMLVKTFSDVSGVTDPELFLFLVPSNFATVTSLF